MTAKSGVRKHISPTTAESYLSVVHRSLDFFDIIRNQDLTVVEFVGLLVIERCGLALSKGHYRGQRALPISEFNKFVLQTRLLATQGGISGLLIKLEKRGLVIKNSVAGQEKKSLFPKAKGWNWVVILLPEGEEVLSKIRRNTTVMIRR